MPRPPNHMRVIVCSRINFILNNRSHIFCALISILHTTVKQMNEKLKVRTSFINFYFFFSLPCNCELSDVCFFAEIANMRWEKRVERVQKQNTIAYRENSCNAVVHYWAAMAYFSQAECNIIKSSSIGEMNWVHDNSSTSTVSSIISFHRSTLK